jgi:hypothetical protein
LRLKRKAAMVPGNDPCVEGISAMGHFQSQQAPEEGWKAVREEIINPSILTV